MSMFNNQIFRRFLTVLLVFLGVAVFSLTTKIWVGILLMILGILIDEMANTMSRR